MKINLCTIHAWACKCAFSVEKDINKIITDAIGAIFGRLRENDVYFTEWRGFRSLRSLPYFTLYISKEYRPIIININSVTELLTGSTPVYILILNHVLFWKNRSYEIYEIISSTVQTKRTTRNYENNIKKLIHRRTDEKNVKNRL